MSRMPIDDHSELGLRVVCDLGNLERNTLFSEVLIGAKPLAGSVACNSELNAPGAKAVTPDEMELSRLRAENARLKMHIEILKKATAYFAKDAL